MKQVWLNDKEQKNLVKLIDTRLNLIENELQNIEEEFKSYDFLNKKRNEKTYLTNLNGLQITKLKLYNLREKIK